MFDTIGSMFFAALRRAAEGRLEAGHPCIEALRQAGSVDDPMATAAAQESLSALDPTLVNAIMADAHRIMREDPRALLGAWPAAGPKH